MALRSSAVNGIARCHVAARSSEARLTDLPDDAAKIPELGARNDRMLRDGARNLLAAAQAAAAERILAQSSAWELAGDPGVTYRELEQAVLDAGGLVIRYG